MIDMKKSGWATKYGSQFVIERLIDKEKHWISMTSLSQVQDMVQPFGICTTDEFSSSCSDYMPRCLTFWKTCKFVHIYNRVNNWICNSKFYLQLKHWMMGFWNSSRPHGKLHKTVLLNEKKAWENCNQHISDLKSWIRAITIRVRRWLLLPLLINSIWNS